MGLTATDNQAITAFALALQSLFADDLQGIILYGSKARGTATAESDIDLLVVLTRDDWSERAEVSRISTAVSLTHNVLIMPKVVCWQRWQTMVQAPFAFFREVFKDGIPIYGEPSFFAPLRRQDERPLLPMLASA